MSLVDQGSPWSSNTSVKTKDVRLQFQRGSSERTPVLCFYIKVYTSFFNLRTLDLSRKATVFAGTVPRGRLRHVLLSRKRGTRLRRKQAASSSRQQLAVARHSSKRDRPNSRREPVAPIMNHIECLSRKLQLFFGWKTGIFCDVIAFLIYRECVPPRLVESKFC